MKKIRLLTSLVIILGLFAMVSGASAQGSYSFAMPQETVNVYWNSDGTEAVDYVFTFNNDPNAHVIDFVDVGMPNGNYDFGSISADVNGAPVNISSDYQGQGGYGFSVDLGGYAIQPGQSGNVHVYVGRISRVLYKDTDDPDTYASAVFSPTWFGSQYIHGSTNLTVNFHLPPDMLPDEPRYHNVEGGWPCANEPAAAYDEQNRITYSWQCAQASGDTQYTFGASFPRQYVPEDAIVVPPAFNFGAFLAGLGGFFQPLCCITFFLGMFVGMPILGAVNQKKRKLAYLPPKIQIEGHGIKRGLTAVEAGILMEQPLDKVMTMALFGVVKKNAATVVTKEPLKLQLASPLPEGLHEYEKDFLNAFASENLADRRKELQAMTIKLVQSVSDKMKGFSRKESVAFYQDIMERAWKQIETAGTPEVKSQMYEEALEWTMLDKNYDDRTRRTFTGPVFMPMWWGRYDPGYGRAASSMSPASFPTGSAGGGGRVSLPGSAMAASLVTGVQNFSSRVLGDLNSFTSGVTNKTNPVPVSTSSGRSSGGGGGRSCACACACAGCACACAGGGR